MKKSTIIKVKEPIVINEEFMLMPGDGVSVLYQDTDTHYDTVLDPEGTQFYNAMSIKTQVSGTELHTICMAAFQILKDQKGLTGEDAMRFLDSDYGREWALMSIPDQWSTGTEIIQSLKANLE